METYKENIVVITDNDFIGCFTAEEKNRLLRKCKYLSEIEFNTDFYIFKNDKIYEGKIDNFKYHLNLDNANFIYSSRGRNRFYTLDINNYNDHILFNSEVWEVYFELRFSFSLQRGLKCPKTRVEEIKNTLIEIMTSRDWCRYTEEQ